MPDCGKSHLIFSKFFGVGPPDPSPALTPSALGSGLRPLTAPLSKIPGSAPDIDLWSLCKGRIVALILCAAVYAVGRTVSPNPKLTRTYHRYISGNYNARQY